MKQLGIAILMWAVVCLATYARTDDEGITPEKQREIDEFQAALRYLDMNGNFFMYMNTKQVQEKLSTLSARAAETFSGPQHRNRELSYFGAFANRSAGLFASVGLDKVTSVGISSSAGDKGGYVNKMAVLAQKDPKGLMWNIFDGSFKPKVSLSKMPSNTILVTGSNISLEYITTWMNEHATAQSPVGKQMKQLLNSMNKGDTFKKFEKTFDGHVGMFVTVDPEKTVTIPLKRRVSVSVPSPGLGIFIKVKGDDGISTLFSQLNEKLKMSSATKDIHGVKATQYILPNFRSPVEFSPVIASHGGFIFITSNEDTMASVLAVSTGKEKGLTATPEFAQINTDSINDCVSYHFVSKDLAKLTVPLADAFPNTMYSRSDRAIFQFLLGELNDQKDYWSFGILRRHNRGYNIEVQSSKATVAGALLQIGAAPVALLSGMMMPSLSNARTKAQRANSSGNLKQMLIALLMYSGDYSGKFPVKDGIEGLQILEKASYLSMSKVYLNPRDEKRMAAYHESPKKLTDKTCSYAYVGGGLRDDHSSATSMPILWEKPHEDNWINIGYLDGHVEGMEAQVTSNVDIVNVLKKRHSWDDSTYNYYLKKAIIIDNSAGIAVEKLPQATKKEMDALIKLLGAPGFAERRDAQKKLKTFLPKSYLYLEEKLESEKDPEINSRLKAILGKDSAVKRERTNVESDPDGGMLIEID